MDGQRDKLRTQKHSDDIHGIISVFYENAAGVGWKCGKVNSITVFLSLLNRGLAAIYLV